MRLRMRRWSFALVLDCEFFSVRVVPFGAFLVSLRLRSFAALRAAQDDSRKIHDKPSILRFAAWSVPEAAKSSKVVAAAWMMWRAMKGAPSAAPCSALLMQHSHSSTAQPSNPYWVSFEKMLRKLTCPSPSDRNRPARSTPDWKPPYAPTRPVGLNSASLT